MPNNSTSLSDADFIANYLIGHSALQLQRELYDLAISKYLAPDSPFDEKLWAFVRGRAAWLYLMDSAFSILNPTHPIRQRVTLMAGILEASPDFTEFFLPRKIGFFSALALVGGLVKFAIASFLGVAVLGILKVLWK